MKKLAELRKELTALKDQASKMLDAADTEDGTLDEDAYGALKDQIAAKTAEITAAEKRAEERRALDALPTGNGQEGERTPALAIAVNDPNPATTGGFKGLAEFASAVRRASAPGGQVDSRLMAAPTGTHIGGAASGEGFDVPSAYSERIFEVVTELDEFGPLVDEEPTDAREVKMNADESTPWGSSGIIARWRNEGGQMDPSKLNTDPRTVGVHQLYAFVLATEELLEDSPRLEARLTRKAGQAIAWKKNDAMVYGTGVGQPLGWFNSQAPVTVPKEGSQAADTIVALNAINMFSRLLWIPGDMPFWIANSDTLPQLMTMTVGDKPIWMPPNGLVDAPGGFLLGRPVKLSEHAKTLGDKGDLQLISPKGYYSLRRESAPRFAQSMHLYFDYATEAFRWTFRFGGQPHLSTPVTPANGSGTKSHFVMLAERA